MSLAHRGVLFLDEAFEFRKPVLQALREPIEEGRIDIVRAGKAVFFPADFQLIIAVNPCPCGNMGNDGKICMCSSMEINTYWKKLGSPLLDRIEVRIPFRQIKPEEMVRDISHGKGQLESQVAAAVEMQKKRFSGLYFQRNSRIPPGEIRKYCQIDSDTELLFLKAARRLFLSARACHSVLRLSRTIADMESSDSIEKQHLLEALQHRRYGDRDYVWNTA